MEQLAIRIPPEIQTRMRSVGTSKVLTSESDPQDWKRRRIEELNRIPGALPGPDCPECLNRGVSYVLDETGYTVARKCRCMVRRANWNRVQKSNLGPILKRCTFETWDASESWRAKAKEIALRYSEAPQGWFLVSGASGSGKTHLCTAICGRLMERGFDTQYMLWRSFSVGAKAAVNDLEAYQQIVAPMKRVHVLYIDDLFKTGRGSAPTSGDVNLALEILNERDNDPHKITIISTELSADELMLLDEALGSRICRQSRGYYLDFRGRENWRMR